MDDHSQIKEQKLKTQKERKLLTNKQKAGQE
jgi:hypothetical protein